MANVALALSGGGFRALLFHLGVIRYLRDEGTLSRVTHITSVSGGSILAAHLVLNWEKYMGSDGDFEQAAAELIKFVQSDVRGKIYRRLLGSIFRRMMLFPLSRFDFTGRLRRSQTDQLEHYYGKYLYGDRALPSLGGEQAPAPKLYLLSTNLTDGELCAFTKDGLFFEGRRRQVISDTFKISRAVAASSAFPGFFPPVVLTEENSGQLVRELGREKLAFTDGGVYDNLGLRKVKHLCVNDGEDFDSVFVSDANATLEPALSAGIFGRLAEVLAEPLKTGLRATDILTSRIYEMEVEAAADLDLIVFSIRREVNYKSGVSAFAIDLQRELAKARTDLDYFSDLEVSALVWHGYCVAQDTRGGGMAEVKSFTPWNPLPHSRDVWARALLASTRVDVGNTKSAPKIDQVRKRLNDATRRKIRAFSVKDAASYVHVGMIILLCLVVIFWSDVKDSTLMMVEGEKISREVSDLTDKLSARYKEDLKSKRYHVNNRVVGYETQKNNPSFSVETWTTSQAAYAELKQADLKPADVSEIFQAVNERFTPCPNDPKIDCYSKDWYKPFHGWYTRPSLRVLDAHPALWTVGALTLLINNPQLDEGAKAGLRDKLGIVQQYLNDLDFYDQESGAWHMFAAQPDKRWYCPYTTTLALQVMLDVRDAKLGWSDNGENDALNRMISSSARWLIESYNYSPGSQGWEPIGNLQNTEVSDAFTFQAFAVLLEAEKRADVQIPQKLINEIPGRLLSLRTRPVKDSAAAIVARGLGEDSINEQEGRISFIWKPWAVRVTRLWVKRLREKGGGSTAVDIFRYENLEHSILHDDLSSFEKTAKDFTFKSSEMLIALSSLP